MLRGKVPSFGEASFWPSDIEEIWNLEKTKFYRFVPTVGQGGDEFGLPKAKDSIVKPRAGARECPKCNDFMLKPRADAGFMIVIVPMTAVKHHREFVWAEDSFQMVAEWQFVPWLESMADHYLAERHPEDEFLALEMQVFDNCKKSPPCSRYRVLTFKAVPKGTKGSPRGQLYVEAMGPADYPLPEDRKRKR